MVLDDDNDSPSDFEEIILVINLEHMLFVKDSGEEFRIANPPHTDIRVELTIEVMRGGDPISADQVGLGDGGVGTHGLVFDAQGGVCLVTLDDEERQIGIYLSTDVGQAILDQVVQNLDHITDDGILMQYYLDDSLMVADLMKKDEAGIMRPPGRGF